MEVADGKVINGYIYFTITGLSPIMITDAEELNLEDLGVPVEVETTPETPSQENPSSGNLSSENSSSAQTSANAPASSGTSQSTNVRKAPKTADSTNALPFISAAVCAAFAIGAAVLIRRRVQKTSN